jgi:uncharacterized protein YkwD
MKSKIHFACCALLMSLGGALYGCAGEVVTDAEEQEENVAEAEAALCTGSSDATTALDTEEQAFLTQINSYRASNGKAALTACKSLSRASQGHSEDMRNQNYFSHTGLNGSSPWKRSCDACYSLGCGPTTAMGENIAAGNTTGLGTFNQWKGSAGHNANMLNGNFKVIGIGRATGGGTYGSYWTTVFGGATQASCAW